MPRPDIRGLAERLLHDPRRDSLGLGVDIEARLDIVDAVAARFFRAPSQEGLRAWQSLLDELSDAVEGEESRARLAAHRALLHGQASF